MELPITEQGKKTLFRLVEKVLKTAVREDRRLNPNEYPTIGDELLHKKMGAFVTYHFHQPDQKDRKHLRGCIGRMVSKEPLWKTVESMAYSAAMEDHRFLPISEEELPYIDFEITVLGPFKVCPDRNAIVLGQHGIMIELNGKRAVFLPQVPLEQGWNLKQTFQHLCIKAGLPAEYWDSSDLNMYWYEGVVLHSNKFE